MDNPLSILSPQQTASKNSTPSIRHHLFAIYLILRLWLGHDGEVLA
jgi:hypothetical protein